MMNVPSKYDNINKNGKNDTLKFTNNHHFISDGGQAGRPSQAMELRGNQRKKI